jgi:hypothetical protein
MGWKPSFQLPHQIFCSFCQTTQKPWTYINMKKTNERNQQKEKEKEWKCFRALPLHWFFPNDLTTKNIFCCI